MMLIELGNSGRLTTERSIRKPPPSSHSKVVRPSASMAGRVGLPFADENVQRP